MKRIALSFITALASWSLAFSVHAQEEAVETVSANPDGLLTIGTQFGEDSFESFGDILVPVYNRGNGVVLLNLRGSGNDNRAEELNAGVVYRHLLPDAGMILGANAYYDSRWTPYNNQFDQFGFGFELLTRDIDFRANIYRPEGGSKLADTYTQTETAMRTYNSYNDPYARGNQIRQNYWQVRETTTTTKLFEKYEQAREGYDLEIGYRLPLPESVGDVRVFGGYYNWEGQYVGQSDISGFKGRVEARVLPVLYLDAAVYEDKELNGGDWYAGARLNVPFNMGDAVNGRNPFRIDTAPKGSRIQDRMYEMVVRDLKIQTEESEWQEDESERTVNVDSTREKKSLVLLDDVTFVDDDNTGVENGTFENPYNTIQEGVNAASSPVYVFYGSYNENVVMRAMVDVLGEGAAIRGAGGRSFGGGMHPVVNGDRERPAFILANNVTLAGFRIIQLDTDGVVTPSVGLLGSPINEVGVYGGNVTGVDIRDNLFESVRSAVRLDAAPGGPSSVDWSVRNNMIQNTSGPGMELFAIGAGTAGDRISILVEGNSIRRPLGDGMNIVVVDYDDAAVGVLNNEVLFPQGVGGINIQKTNNRRSMVEISGNSVVGGLLYGTFLSSVFLEMQHMTVEGNTFNSNPAGGLFANIIGVPGSGGTLLEVHNNTALGNTGFGMFFTAVNTDGNIFANITGNDIQQTAGMGLFTTLVTSGPGWVRETLSDNNFNNTAGIGFFTTISTLNGSELYLVNNQFNNVVGLGMQATVIAALVPERIYAEGNSFVGNLGSGAIVTYINPNALVDFGGGALGSPGNNRIFGNVGAGLVNAGGATISAQNNYWGGGFPSVVGSPVDYSNQLMDDPGTP